MWEASCVSLHSLLAISQVHSALPALPPLIPMLGKRKRAVSSDASPGRRLRDNIVDLYGRGTISAQRCSSLLSDAGNSNVQSCQVGQSTSRARDLQRALVKESGWPPLYLAEAPIKGVTGEETKAEVAFLLPHEVLYELVQIGDLGCIGSREGWFPCLSPPSYSVMLAALPLPPFPPKAALRPAACSHVSDCRPSLTHMASFAIPIFPLLEACNFALLDHSCPRVSHRTRGGQWRLSTPFHPKAALRHATCLQGMLLHKIVTHMPDIKEIGSFDSPPPSSQSSFLACTCLCKACPCTRILSGQGSS